MNVLFLAQIIAAAQTPALPEPSSYSAIGWLVVAGAGLFTAINQADDFFARRRSKPPTGELQLTTDGLCARLAGLEGKYDHFMSQCEQKHAGLALHETAIQQAADAKMDALRLEVKADLKALETKLDESFKQLNSSNSARGLEIHKRVNLILEGMAELRGAMNGMTK